MTESTAREKYCGMLHPIVIPYFRCVAVECHMWAKTPNTAGVYGTCAYLEKETSCESDGRGSAGVYTMTSDGSSTKRS